MRREERKAEGGKDEVGEDAGKSARSGISTLGKRASGKDPIRFPRWANTVQAIFINSSLQTTPRRRCLPSFVQNIHVIVLLVVRVSLPDTRSNMASAATKKDPEIIELSRGLAHIPQCEEFERMISGMLSVKDMPLFHNANSS